MRSRLRLATVLLAAWVLGCAHGTVQLAPPMPAALPSGRIGNVTVSLAPTLPESRRVAFVEHDGEPVVRQAIVDAFTERAHWDPSSPEVLHVTVTVFRLRSTANAAINGYFAGIDMLEGVAEMTNGDAAPVHYTFKLSGAEDQYFKWSSSARFRSLARCLGTELAGYIVPAAPGM